ncbi:MAG: hypothetical protein QOI74_3904 [Micromonosporaceae bacterium]|nr:hypothetical protein [Micromonosporaceae bacterium]MDT5035906.1 hypothetical protein [Micromonosporaceae bacterium]
MHVDLATNLLIAAVAANGLLSGASGDQSVKQLPARRHIGVSAYSDYSRSADLGNGIAWYAVLGIGTALLSVVTGVIVLGRDPTGQQVAAAVTLIVATVAHMGLTAVAAPTNMSQRRHIGDEAALTRVFDRFERLQTARWVFNLAALGAAGWLLVASLRAA